MLASRNGPGANLPPGLKTARSMLASGHLALTAANAARIDSGSDASASSAVACASEGSEASVASSVAFLRESRARA